jgi:hypothetical protein
VAGSCEDRWSSSLKILRPLNLFRGNANLGAVSSVVPPTPAFLEGLTQTSPPPLFSFEKINIKKEGNIL